MKRLSRTSLKLSTAEPDKGRGTELESSPASPTVMRDLQEFLVEAELSEYYSPLLTRLKVPTVEHIKYVKETDLQDIGMTRPEMRRLKKFYKKECPQGAISKLRKAIMKGGDGSNRTTSPSSPTQRGPLHFSTGAPYLRPPGRQLIPMDSIQLGRTLGQGEFGVVQQGIWKTEFGETLQVAVKQLSKERINTGTQNFLKEAAIMQDVDHEHIVRMYGVVLDTEDNMMLVTELAPMRSLLECLKDQTLHVDLSVTRLCDYAIQVCEGMGYLESKRLVHRDLAARNILVFNKNQVKISDLGLSRILEVGQDYYQCKFSASLKLPIAWCAPECINFLKFTSASDVWSFAVMLWEFFTYGFQPWAGLNGQQILQAIDEPNSQRLEQPDLCTNELYKLMKECWTHHPETRPSFSDILLRLPQLKPTQVKALKDSSPLLEKGYLYYKAGDVIVVINKSPVTSSPPGLVWRGVHCSGKCGLFDPTNTVPFIEPKVSSIVTGHAVSIVRKDSLRKSGRKIRADMISQPQNDLRHTGHIGYDGAVFGDVSFIGDNYDKLPVQVGTGSGTNHGSAGRTLPPAREIPDQNGHNKSRNAQDCLDNNRNNYGQPWMNQETLNNQSTFQLDQDGRSSPNYLDIEDDALFSDFKMPDLGSSFECGSSFMDEVLRALDEKERQVISHTDNMATISTSHFWEPNIKTTSRSQPPVPAPRESRTPSSSSAPLLPAQQQKAEHVKEKKQPKVKPMSASEERMVDTAMARVRELTSHMIGGAANSPPVSPLQDKGSSFFGEDTGLLSRLKNSMKRSGSPKNERKRTFSEELEHKGDLDEVTPEAQQAYNMLVVKGSFKDRSTSSSHRHQVTQDYGNKDMSESTKAGNLTPSKGSHELESFDWSQPNLVRESATSSNSTKMSAHTVVSSSQLTPVITGPHMSSQISTSPNNKHKGISLPKPTSNSASRCVQIENIKKTEIPTSLSHTETHRDESTVWNSGPASPEIPPKSGKRTENHIPVLASREEQQKKPIIIVQLDDSESTHGDVLDKADISFEQLSARSSQSSSGDHTSETAESGCIDWIHSEFSPDNSKDDQDLNTGTVSSIDLFSKTQTASTFEEDLSTPSPQEIMNKLRERRLNQQLDQQRTLVAENETSNAGTMSRQQPSSHEQQSIPGRVTSIDTVEGGEVEGNQEVDTNPLRMLRGGAIPIRTAGKGLAGTGNHGNRGAVALRVPQLNFSRHFSRSVTDQQMADLAREDEAAITSIPGKVSTILLTVPTDNDNVSKDCAAELTRQVEESTNPSTDVNCLEFAIAAMVEKSDAAKEPKNCSSHDLQLGQKMSFPLIVASSELSPCIDSTSPSNETLTDADESSAASKIPVQSGGEALTPPRLPPRRSKSLNENSEKIGTHLSVLPCSLRRSNSVEESNDSEAPALPPRKPHAGRTPLNVRPRERKFPLQRHFSSQDKPTSPRQMNTEAPTFKHNSHLKSSVHTVPSPPTSLTPTLSHPQPMTSAASSRQQQSSAVHSPNSPSCRQSHRHPVLNNSFMSQSLDSPTASHHLHHHHHSNSVDLPPAYDLSVNHPILSSSTVADSEPTHMLLDLHTPHLPLPLSVNLPPSSDLSAIDEPTHVSLSSLTDNKHSWSATFTSPSPLSPSFSRRQHIVSHSSQSNASPSMTRAFDKSLNNDARIRLPGLYPSYSDNQSPPADLPPAPPTPSYREKLGLEQQKPKVLRSISHTPNTQRCGSNFLTVDSASSPASYRGRSSSTNLPASHSHHTDASLTSPTHSSSHHAFHLTHRSCELDDGDDDAFFAEAPSYPHPYSQSPFHPHVPPSPKDVHQSSSVCSSTSLLHAAPNISPYQVSSTISLSNHPSKRLSPTTVSRLDLDPPPLVRRSVDSYSTPSHTQIDKHMSAPQPTSPRTSLTHTNNTVSLPVSHPAPMSPSNSRIILNNCLTTSANSVSHEPGGPQAAPQSKQKLDLPQSSRTFRVFKFPNLMRTDIVSSTSLSNSAASSADTHPRNIIASDLSPTVDYPSSSEVSPLMFASYSAASSVSYEDLRQFALDRQKNCEEIETLLKIFPDQVTVEECMTALETTQWDVTKATKYLQLKKLLSLGVADVYKCKEALTASGWNLQCAAEALLESSRAPGVPSRRSPAKPGMITSHNRPATPEIVDV